MSYIKPKTIIIQPACQYGTVVTASSILDLDVLMEDRSSSDDENSAGGPRKRRRLTSLTPEEKMVRRKLKNRVAAQTARDRKKQHMNELEEMIAILQCENKQLVTENEDLRRTKATLLEENKQLKQRLEMTSNSVDVKPELDVVTRKLSDAVTESAVLDTPLQRETVRTSIQLTAAYYLAWLTLLLMIRSSDSSKKCSTEETSQTHSNSPTSVEKHKMLHQIEWWGRHQRNWNPPMN